MNLLSLRYFKTTADLLNFTKASEKLHISQQALSAHIKSLEQEFNVQLFNRKKNVTLTYAGLILANRATEMLKLENSVYEEMQHLSQPVVGKVNVAINETRAYSLLPVIMDRFYKEYPYVELAIIEGDLLSLQTALTDGANIAIGADMKAPGITEDRIQPERMCLLIPSSFLEGLKTDEAPSQTQLPKTVSNMLMFKDLPFVMLKRGMAIRNWADRYLYSERIVPKIALETTGVRTMFSMVEKGLGISFCQESLLYSFQDSLETARPSVLVFPVESKKVQDLHLSFFYRNDKELSSQTQWLISIIREYYAARSIHYDGGYVRFT